MQSFRSLTYAVMTKHLLDSIMRDNLNSDRPYFSQAISQKTNTWYLTILFRMLYMN